MQAGRARLAAGEAQLAAQMGLQTILCAYADIYLQVHPTDAKAWPVYREGKAKLMLSKEQTPAVGKHGRGAW